MNLNLGSTLQGGQYKIEKVLGQGGFGITYLAEQKVVIEGSIGKINTTYQVTIKEFFMKGLCDRDNDTSHVSVGSTGSRELVDRFKAKFIKEAQNIAKLDHDHIIKVLDVFEENGTAYYVMEYIDGGSLNDRISQYGAMSEMEALHYIRQIADALKFIHNRNMNHLDVKPSNILLKEGAISVLIDFGLAKQYDNSGDQTSSAPVGVSKGYAPMEQYKAGGVSKFSPETDIYSLGATLYKLVTGTKPPEAYDIFSSGLPELPVNLSGNTKQAIISTMNPSSEKRPRSIEEFLNILDGSTTSEETCFAKPEQASQPQPTMAQQELQSELTIQSPEPQSKSKPESQQKQQQKKSYLGIIMGVVVALIIMAVGAIFVNSYIEEEKERIERNYREEKAAAKKAEEERLAREEQAAAVKKAEEERLAREEQAAAVKKAEEERLAKEEAINQNKLGNSYYNAKNYTEAVKCYRKSAAQGNEWGQNNLGNCYYYGHGVSQNYTEAVNLYRKAIEQGNAYAQNSLGNCYYNGYGVTQNYTEAVKWYRKAVEQGDADAQNNLGYCYQHGYGVTKDYTEAVKWYRKAVEQGNADAQNNLGYCYQYGYGVTKDYSEAVKWYRKSADQGNASGQYNLGYCYQHGHGVTKNYSEAVKLYRKAAAQGNEAAIESLKKLGEY